MVSGRKGAILRIIVEEYVATATPVASESIAHNYALGVSPATIRNDVAWLENEGYILRPHTSAGAVPSDKAYRYYIESALQSAELPEAEQFSIRRLFHQVERELEEWMRLASALLSQRLRSVAVVTQPQAPECRLKHMELIALQEFLVLIILVLREARLIRQLLSFDKAVSQDELTAMANKINASYEGLTFSEIRSKELKLSPLEVVVRNAIVRAMEAEEEQQHADFYLNGLRHLLSQPEFAQSVKALEILELLEERSALKAVLGSLRGSEGIRVTIGGENKEKALQECSLVFGSYGVPRRLKGAIGVIGPTRMPYSQVIPTVRYLSTLMSELVIEL